MTGPAPEQTQTTLLRHIVPVLVGGLLVAMLTGVTVNWVNAHGWAPDPAQPGRSGRLLLFVLAYQTLFTVVGSHMAARLAPEGQPRIRYALAVGALLSVVSIISATGAWGQFPTWYLLAAIVLPVPAAIIGGGTATRALAQRSQP